MHSRTLSHLFHAAAYSLQATDTDWATHHHSWNGSIAIYIVSILSHRSDMSKISGQRKNKEKKQEVGDKWSFKGPGLVGDERGLGQTPLVWEIFSLFRCSLPKAMSISRSEILRKKKEEKKEGPKMKKS